jgi:hypothetical protein
MNKLVIEVLSGTSATGTFLLIYGILGSDKPDSIYRALVVAIMTERAIFTYKKPHVTLLFTNTRMRTLKNK